MSIFSVLVTQSIVLSGYSSFKSSLVGLIISGRVPDFKHSQNFRTAWKTLSLVSLSIIRSCVIIGLPEILRCGANPMNFQLSMPVMMLYQTTW